MTAPHSPTRPDDTTRKIELNLANVAAAALAAVTTAVLGSVLGAAGTLIGAAGASVITTVGTAIYQASLERSRERVRSLTQRTRPLSSSRERSGTERSHSATANAPLDDQLTESIHGPQPWDRSQRFIRLRWGAMIVGALGAFVLAMVVITGFEWASGGTVGGNGKGTTIGQVVTDQPGLRNPATPPAPRGPGAPASETPTPIQTPTQTTEAPTSTSSPDGGDGVEQSPTKTSDRPAPSEVTPTPTLIPTRLPGIGG
ncbi:MAG TPA: hypothetical protein VGO16_18940 [Pseudonocardiaceae bacterium]|nr:hypothetical protein [Pseudonocardiaceae bacterium]